MVPAPTVRETGPAVWIGLPWVALLSMSAPLPARNHSHSLEPVPPPTAAGKDSIGNQISAVVHAVLGALRRTGGASAADLAGAVEVPLRALTRRIVAEALARPRPVPDAGTLTAQLSERPGSPLLGGASAAAMAAKVARRLGPLRFLARRTPMWIVAAAVPALYASVARGAEEISLVASHLVLRTRADGHEPDGERVRRVAVHLVAGAPADPDREPRHGPLILAWLNRAFRATLPFTKGVATADPHRIGGDASAVPTSALRAQADDRA